MQLHRWRLALLAPLACAAVAATGSVQAAPKAQVHTVLIDGTRFSPPVIEVHAGDVVVWKNKDPFPHTVTATDHAFDSGPIAENHAWRFKARKRGTIPYVCTLHPNMHGTLIVR